MNKTTFTNGLGIVLFAIAAQAAMANTDECVRDLFYRGYAFGYDAKRICQTYHPETINCAIDLAEGRFGFFGDLVLTCDMHSQSTIECAKFEFTESERRYSSFYDAVKYCERQ